MKTRWFTPRGGRLLAVLLAACLQATALADDADLLGRVARLSDLEGPVSLEPAGMADWTAATLNRPLVRGDRLWADQNARAELDLGDAAVRLGADTGFAFFELDDAVAQMQLTGGILIVRVRDLAPPQVYEVDTPNLAVSLQQNGEYRLEVNERGDLTTLKVAEGAAQALGGGLWLAVGAGQSVTFSGTTTLAYSASSLGAADDFDEWSEARDQALESARAAPYLPSDLPGAADLEGNGSWQQSLDYGVLWTPATVVAGWVPYRSGRWLWVSPWGWTWVDDARWGYAPFHYGRWVRWRNSWCWVPPPRLVHPVYAPALVGWLSGTAEVGWFPLGPHEPYLARAPLGAGDLRGMNQAANAAVSGADGSTSASNAGARYVNAHGPALSRVPRDVFTSGQQVSSRLLQTPLPVAARPDNSAPAIAPIRQSVLGLAQGRGVRRPPAQEFTRTVVVRRTPPPAPLPFEKIMAALQASDEPTAARDSLAAARPPMSAVRLIAPTGVPLTLNVPRAVRRGLRDPLNLAARERLLEQSRISGTAGSVVSRSPATVAQVNAFVPPALTGEEAPPAVRPSNTVPATAGHSSSPAYHAAGVPVPSASTSQPAQPSPPPSLSPAPPRSSAPPHAAHSSAAVTSAPHETSRESRDGAPHADRASRERAVR
jgi:hypothetical protein